MLSEAAGLALMCAAILFSLAALVRWDRRERILLAQAREEDRRRAEADAELAREIRAELRAADQRIELARQERTPISAYGDHCKRLLSSVGHEQTLAARPGKRGAK